MSGTGKAIGNHTSSGAMVLVVFMLAAPLLSACRAESMNPFNLLLSVNQAALASGRVIVESKFTNSSSSELRILNWNTPLDERVTGRIYVINKEDKTGSNEIPYTGILIKRAAPTPEDFSVIAAGQTLENEQDVTKSYTFCANSRYILAYSGTITTANDDSLQVERRAVEFTTGAEFPKCSGT